MNKNNQINPVESGMEYLESIEDLGLKLDNIRFESIIDISKSKKEDIKVYDLEIEDNHNYQVDGLGIVHNGGGK